jgi:hypothetical protein
MISWVEADKALRQRRTPEGGIDFDGYRREQYLRLNGYTNRPLIVYATDFLNRPKVQACGNDVEIDLSDREGVLEVTRSLDAETVDFLITSPGGGLEAADSIVSILRRKFGHIRIIVPSVAKSAATMIALSANELLMDGDAELGPIDPQFRIQKGDGSFVVAPAQAIIDQFEKAQELIGKDQSRLAAWLPILQQYGPALYQQCKNAVELSKDYVREWLKTGLFKEMSDAAERATRVVDYLGNHNEFKTHGARIGVNELRKVGIDVKIINEDKELHERVLCVVYALALTFNGTPAFRLWENSRGGALIRSVQMMGVPPGSTPPVPQRH